MRIMGSMKAKLKKLSSHVSIEFSQDYNRAKRVMVIYLPSQQVSDALQKMYNKSPNHIVKHSKRWRSDDDYSARATYTILPVLAFTGCFSIFTDMKNCQIFIKKHLGFCLNLPGIATAH